MVGYRDVPESMVFKPGPWRGLRSGCTSRASVVSFACSGELFKRKAEAWDSCRVGSVLV